jgi:parvulin-like peptidyl-prolyl isomerase
MAKRKNRVEEEAERELTRKEIRLRQRDRERHRVLYTWTGAALGLALLLIIAGAVYQFAYIPNSTIASVAGEPIVTKDFWQRMRLERSQLQNQLVNMQQLQQQFGQQFFAQQINQIEGQLASPFALAVGVLDKMIDERIVASEAVSRSITVSNEEVDETLREEVARGRNAVTAPQATSTAEAAASATATATLWTPTPTPTIDANLIVTATATPSPTPPPLPTSAVLSDTGYTEGLTQLEEGLSTLNAVDLAGYREVIRARLLADKLSKVIGDEKVTATETQVHARHILIRVMTPTVSITDTGMITAPMVITDTAATTATAPVSPSVPTTTTAAVTATAAITTTPVVAESAPVTAAAPTTDTTPTTATTVVTAALATTATTPVTTAAAVTGTAGVTATAAVTGTPGITATTPVTPTIPPPTPVERTDAEALALAQEIQQRLLAGESFDTLARQYSDDTGSGAQGGDLGWFGKGRMVAPFEEAAFSQEIGQISEPIKSEFGYHIIEVLEKDENRPKDPNQIEQERQQAYQTWLNEAKTATAIERPEDLTALLPRDLR